MGSPDASRYTSLVLYDRGPYELFQQALTDASAKLPGWTPRTGSVETVMAESLSVILSEAIYALNRLPDGIAEVLIGNFGIQRNLGAYAKATVTLTVADSVGREVPQGTAFRLVFADNSVFDFVTDESVVIPTGSTTADVGITATNIGAAPNGVAVGTQLSLITSIPYLSGAALATSPSGGSDPETADEWRDRAITKFRSLTSTLVKPQQFTDAVLQSASVYRAFTLDNWNINVAAAGYVTVAVADVEGNALSAAGMAELENYLDSQSLSGLSVNVVAPTYTNISIASQLTALPGYVLTEIQTKANAALQEYLSPETWAWDAKVRINELIVLLGNVEGVDYVNSVTINNSTSDLALSGNFPLVRSGTHTVAVSAALPSVSGGQAGDPVGGGTIPSTEVPDGTGSTTPPPSGGDTGGGSGTNPAGGTGGSPTTPIGGATGNGGSGSSTGNAGTTGPVAQPGTTIKQTLLETDNHWWSVYVRPDGCVLQKESDNKSVSEGVGYAMESAVLTNNQQRYDQVVYFADVYMRRGAPRNKSLGKTTALHLLGWSFNPNNNTLIDGNFATDGEMDRAWAAWRAWKLWGREQDKLLFTRICRDIIQYGTIADGNMRFMVTDEWQQGRTNNQGFNVWEMNVSYYRLRFMKLAAAELSEPKFTQLVDTFYANLLPEVTTASGGLPTTKGLPPEWNDWNTGSHKAGAITNGVRGWQYSRDTYYGYNAFRTLVTIYDDYKFTGDTRALAYLQGAIKTTFKDLFTAKGYVPGELEHNGAIRGDYSSNLYNWPAYFTQIAGDANNATGAAIRPALDIPVASDANGKFWPTSNGQPTAYYNDWWIWMYHAIDSGLAADLGSQNPTSTYPLVPSSVDIPPSLVVLPPVDTTGVVTNETGYAAGTTISISTPQKLYRDPDSNAAAEVVRQSDATLKARLRWLANIPQFFWTGPDWDGEGIGLKKYVDGARAAGLVPLITMYGIPFRDFSTGLSSSQVTNNLNGEEYLAWVRLCSQIIGTGPAVICYEPDSIPQSVGLAQKEQDARYSLMKQSVMYLKQNNPGARTYMDAGHSLWLGVDVVAPLLVQAGVAYCAGISTNVSNYRPDGEVRAYSLAILAKIGISSLNYIYDTSRNGGNPPDGSDWANPPNRQFGLLSQYGGTNVERCDGYLFIKRPGESDGTQHGGPPAGEWWAEYILDMLTRTPTPQVTPQTQGQTGTPTTGGSSGGTSGGQTTTPVTAWQVPGGWVEVTRDEFQNGLSNWGIYAQSEDIAVDNGFWRGAQVQILNVESLNELQLLGTKRASDNKPVGGAALWLGPGNKTAENLGGRWEATIRYNSSAGFGGILQLWPATESGGATQNGQIDIVRFASGSRVVTESNFYLGTPQGRRINTQHPTNIDWTQWHDVAVEWVPNNRLKVYVDGVVVAQTTDTSYIPSTMAMHIVFQQNFYDNDLAHYEAGPIPFRMKRVRYLKATT